MNFRVKSNHTNCETILFGQLHLFCITGCHHISLCGQGSLRGVISNILSSFCQNMNFVSVRNAVAAIFIRSTQKFDRTTIIIWRLQRKHLFPYRDINHGDILGYIILICPGYILTFHECKCQCNDEQILNTSCLHYNNILITLFP